ncbi:MAG TPA: hypothetical protein VGL81_15825 [Polyangiaceae bacterium]|jgi:hypothetical protein
MRAVLERFDAGQTIALQSELQAALAPGEMEALRAAGIVRDTGSADVVELSLADLVRALRDLYGAEGRGIVAWSTLQPTPMAVGVATDAAGPRDVVLVSGARHGFEIVAMRPRRTLVLTFIADDLTSRRRAQHPASATVAIEVLEESLVVRRNRLALRGARPAAVAATVPEADPGEAPAPAQAPARTRGGSPPRFPGAATWAQVRIEAQDWHTVRIEHGPHVSRATAVDLRMAHAVTRKPTVLWAALQAICDGHGTFRGRRFGNAQATKKTLSRLALELRTLFGIDESPFFPYSRGLGYSTRFVADDRVAEQRKNLTPEEQAAVQRAELDADLGDYREDLGGPSVDED